MKLLPGVDPGFAERGAKFFGVFRVKNHDFTPKNHIFSILGGGVRPSPWLLYCLINNEDGLLLTCSN